MHAVDVSQADFEERVVKASYKQPVVIDFWAPWCGPCKVLKPMLEKLAEEFGGKFVLAKVNSDENQELSAKYAVRSIPAVKAMVNGQLVDEFAGQRGFPAAASQGDVAFQRAVVSVRKGIFDDDA